MEAVHSCITNTQGIFQPLWKMVEKKTVVISSSKEEYCRRLFETHTGHKFPSVRPNWLRQERTQKNLELDGYCEYLKLAFEYDGEQHYKYPNSFHKTLQEFREQRDRDALKEALCSRQGVKIIRIRQDNEDIAGYIKSELEAYMDVILKQLD
jgi:very-short-patch-repair endonuclease